MKIFFTLPPFICVSRGCICGFKWKPQLSELNVTFNLTYGSLRDFSIYIVKKIPQLIYALNVVILKLVLITICETDLSDCYNLLITISACTKLPPKTIICRSYKNFIEEKFEHELDQQLM